MQSDGKKGCFCSSVLRVRRIEKGKCIDPALNKEKD